MVYLQQTKFPLCNRREKPERASMHQTGKNAHCSCKLFIIWGADNLTTLDWPGSTNTVYSSQSEPPHYPSSWCCVHFKPMVNFLCLMFCWSHQIKSSISAYFLAQNWLVWSVFISTNYGWSEPFRGCTLASGRADCTTAIKTPSIDYNGMFALVLFVDNTVRESDAAGPCIVISMPVAI